MMAVMSDWDFAQADPAQQLARLHLFSMQKAHEGGEVEFVITVKEFVSPPDPAAAFFASADKQTNQKTAAYTATGWGNTLLAALAQCMREVERFPYQG
jgi:hypothetical protein